jgi:hypothetical protein
MSAYSFISQNRSSAETRGLAINQVTWEDTGRFKGSCVGSNISDMTLSCKDRNQPVIRKPNFSDVTADQPLDNFKVVVGNESGQPLRQIPLSEYLDNLHTYTGNSNIRSMRLDRDNSVLTSAQACVLVEPSNSDVNFCVQLYNYQSSEDDPAVLVILSSAQGTSCQVVSSSSTELYFNKNGTATDFKAVRLQDDRASRGVTTTGAPQTVDEKDKNALFIFQVPLKVTRRPLTLYSMSACSAMPAGPSGPGGVFACGTDSSWGSPEIIRESATFGVTRGMDWAQISSGNEHGRYKGTGSLTVTRDADLPIRCTVQYYHITDSERITDTDFDAIEAEISRVYTRGATATGSLITSNTLRQTEPVFHPPTFTSTRATFM